MRAMKVIRPYRCLLYLSLSLISLQIGVLYKWNWFCTNHEPMRHASKLCKQYRMGFADGLLCYPMCQSHDIHTLECNSYQTTPKTVFYATWGEATLVFKLAASKDISVLRWYDNGILKYPSERDFIAAIRSVTKTLLNLTVSNEVVRRLNSLNPRINRQLSPQQRRTEMDNIWILIQDNEYLLSIAFWENDVFPQLIGTCGNYFALEFIEPISHPFSIWYDKDSVENWRANLKLSILVMEVLEELENNFKEPLHLCDIKFSDLGLTTRENGRVKILNVESVYPKSIVNQFIDNLDFCIEDSDCTFLECRGRCNTNFNKCIGGVYNNNLQLVCEKIFLGWRMQNTVILPGLLMSRHAPNELIGVLLDCANPYNEPGVGRAAADEEMRKLLYTVLTEIDESFSEDPFLM